MSKTASAVTQSKKPGVNWGAAAPGIAFVLIVATGIALYLGAQSAEVRKSAESAQQAQKLGLPQGFPLQDIPLYPALQISEQSSSETESTDGKPMDKWELKATSPDDKMLIANFYKDKLLARGMGQTQYISIPTGIGVTYGDERYSVELEIEKLSGDKVTRFVMRVYRLKG
ncbi:MAG: hypothetical protein M3R04_04090 [bacterium]|nr:hypothetical protein [bacterium]